MAVAARIRVACLAFAFDGIGHCIVRTSGEDMATTVADIAAI